MVAFGVYSYFTSSTDFGTFLLAILMVNSILYASFYIAMKVSKFNLNAKQILQQIFLVDTQGKGMFGSYSFWYPSHHYVGNFIIFFSRLLYFVECKSYSNLHSALTTIQKYCTPIFCF